MPLVSTNSSLVSILPRWQVKALLQAQRLEPPHVALHAEQGAVLIALGDAEVLHLDVERFEPLLIADHLQPQLGQLLVFVFHAVSIPIDLNAKCLDSLLRHPPAE